MVVRTYQEELKYLEKVGNCTWRIKKDFVPNMKVYVASFGPHQANLVLIAYASSEGSGEPAHPRSLARTPAARSYKQ